MLRSAPRDIPLRTRPSRRTTGPRVRLVGGITALAAPGGGEVQLVETARALAASGLDARLYRPWEDAFDSFDVLHLFGSLPEHVPLALAARRRGVRVVLSTIAWFDLASRWHAAPGRLARLSDCGKLLLRAAVPRWPSWRRRLYVVADRLLPNSAAEARQLVRWFALDEANIRIVPNGADPRIAAADPEPFARRAGGRGFVLCAGRIEPRKNQLALLRALRDAPWPVVVLGDVVPGHEEYARRCRAAAGPRVQFHPAVPHDDPLLASALAACGCLVLPSWFETPGLVALEAAQLGTPLVLTSRGATHEYFGRWAQYIEPDDPASMRHGVAAALSMERRQSLARMAESRYTWAAVARETRAVYDELV